MNETGKLNGGGPGRTAVMVSALAKVYETPAERLEVLRGVDLSVEAETTVAVTGESGCGKSTLLNLVGGLDHPTAGRVFVGATEVTALAETELSGYRNREVGFIFQFHFLLKDFTAMENVMIPAMIGRLAPRELRARARRLLAEVGLERRADAYPLELSGGERQRVAVARALVNEPALILADEPTGNLDEANARTVEEILFGLVRAHGRTMILATHDPALAGRADRRLILGSGRLSTP
jgi:lipoprotein-releasing system ATP-binding protein